MPDSRNIENLFQKYISNTCSREEMGQLLGMIENENQDHAFAKQLKAHWDKIAEQANNGDVNVQDKFAQLMREVRMFTADDMVPERKTKRWYVRLAAAAIVFCLLSAGAYFLLKRDSSSAQVAKKENTVQNKNNNDVLPGKNTAILTLADGSTVALDETQNGIVSTQGNAKVVKLDNGMLTYKTSDHRPAEMVYNTITTPKGGQYQLILSDGSKVWLNAASSLKFPATFTGKDRKVELLGEAYFEVAPLTPKGGHEKMPFKVEAEGMEVEVLGTHFNINSYENETSSRTTLLEGSVKINHGNTTDFLKPGQQARLNRDGDIKIINDADVDEAIAWKEGRFQFNRSDIHDVMRQVARWYDVSVEYKGIVSSHFGGTVSRDVNLSQVLKMLELTGELKFQVEGRKVTVVP